MDPFFYPLILAYCIFLLLYLGIAFFVASQAKRYAYLGDKTNSVLTIFWGLISIILVITLFFCWSLDWTTVPFLGEALIL